MFGDGDLRHLEHSLKVADAKRPFGKEVEDTQPGFVTQAAVNLNQC